MASDALPENLSADQSYLNGSPPQSPPTTLASALMLQSMYSRMDSGLRGSPAGSNDTSPRRDGPHPSLPPPGAFSAAALCDQFCSVINGFRGYDPRLKSASSSRAVAAEATECKLIDYRGEKIAAFEYRGEYLLCLPQAFELFLKHLVGGLHTVYTKLKRLGISPIVCNVEQVRVLRGLGAIQPGVNRCKLLSCKDFDCLYKDCTTARPGRPPKRASLVGLGGTGYPPPLLKPGENADYESFKSDYVRGEEDGDYNFPAMLFKMWSQGQQAAGGGDGKGGGGYPPGLGPPHVDPSLSMLGLGSQHANAYQRHLLSGGLGLPLASIAQAHLGRQQDKARQAGVDLCSPRNAEENAERDSKSRGSEPNRKSRSPGWPREENDNNASALNLSQSGGTRLRDGCTRGEEDDDEIQGESDYGDEKDSGDISEDSEDSISSGGGGRDSKLSDSGGLRAGSEGPDSQLLQLAEKNGLLGGGIGSIETLLQNILGLLKVAEENARRQEQRVHMERAELKVEILRERELREGLEKKLQEEQNRRLFYQKRLRREKRCRRQVQDQLEGEVKKRTRYEEALRTTLSDSQIPKETLQEETKTEDTVAMESDNSVKSR